MSDQGIILIKYREPKMYKVFAINDSNTPMEYAGMIYQCVFGVEDLNLLFQTLHEENRVLLGVYTSDIAHTKAQIAFLRSRKAGYDMMFEIEPDEET